MRHAFGLLAAVALISLPVGAAAGPAVVYGPGLDAETATARARAFLESDDFTVVGGLAELAGDGAVIVGAATTPCTGAETPMLLPLLMGAQDAVINMEYGDALSQLGSIDQHMPCIAKDASRDQLYELYFLQGYAHFEEGHTEDALSDFTVAASLDPKRAWDPTYPPGAKELYLSALQDVFERQRLGVRVEVESALIDGDAVGLATKARVIAGTHVVRIGDDVFLAEVSNDEARAHEDVVLTTSRKLVAGLQAGEERYAPWLADLAEGRSWGDSVLVLGGETPQLMRYRSFDEPTVSAGVGPETIGPVLMGVGGGLLGVGLALHGAAYNDAGIQEPSKRVLVDSTTYERLVSQNRAGFGLAVAGGVVLGAGLVTTIIGLTGGSPKATAWAAPTEGGVTLGIGGRF